MTIPLSLTGEYQEPEWNPDDDAEGPGHVIIRVNGNAALRIPSYNVMAKMYPARRQEAIEDAFMEVLAELGKDIEVP